MMKNHCCLLKTKRMGSKFYCNCCFYFFLFLNVAPPLSEKIKQQPASLRNSHFLFDSLRYKWKEVLVGGNLNTADPDYLHGVRTIVAEANSYWSSMLGVSARED